MFQNQNVINCVCWIQTAVEVYFSNFILFFKEPCSSYIFLIFSGTNLCGGLKLLEYNEFENSKSNFFFLVSI